MATLIKLPQFGVTMTEATVVAWLKSVGDTVERGDAVANIETDKLNQEVMATASGILRRIVVPVGGVAKVMEALAVLGTASEPESAIDAALGVAAPVVPATKTEPAKAPASASSSTAPTRAEDEGAAVRASPLARRLAGELGVNLARVQGSGPGGRIVEEDVRTAAASGQAGGWILASPLARRLARDAGVDLGSVTGSGPEGRIVERDIQALIAAHEVSAPATTSSSAPVQATPAHAPSIAAGGLVAAPAVAGLTRRETVRIDAMRRIIAERMSASLQTTAQLTMFADADATALVELRAHLVPAAKVYGHRPPTYTDIIVSIVSRVLRDHPRLNSSLVTGDTGSPEIAEWNEVNIGVAVALDAGLVVPVIRDADRKPLQTISQELGELAESARAGRLAPDTLQGGTFTITNLGQMEVDGFTPIINPPQAAILGIGRIAKRPAVVDDVVVARSQVTLSLTFDHRIVDGAPGGAFLRDVRRAIEAGKI